MNQWKPTKDRERAREMLALVTNKPNKHHREWEKKLGYGPAK